jgi:hypothetical protein
MLFYRAALPLSSRTLTFVADLIRRHRAAIGSPWHKLNPARQALLVLAYLRKGDTFAELAAGFDVGTTTAWRYVSETTDLLAARAPKLRTAVRDAVRPGHAYVGRAGWILVSARRGRLLSMRCCSSGDGPDVGTQLHHCAAGGGTSGEHDPAGQSGARGDVRHGGGGRIPGLQNVP